MQAGTGPAQALDQENMFCQYVAALFWGMGALSGLGSGLQPTYNRHSEVTHLSYPVYPANYCELAIGGGGSL